jgi:hypothetical protein
MTIEKLNHKTDLTYAKDIEDRQGRKDQKHNLMRKKKGIKQRFHKSTDRLATNQNDHHHGYI